MTRQLPLDRLHDKTKTTVQIGNSRCTQYTTVLYMNGTEIKSLAARIMVIIYRRAQVTLIIPAEQDYSLTAIPADKIKQGFKVPIIK